MVSREIQYVFERAADLISVTLIWLLGYISCVIRCAQLCAAVLALGACAAPRACSTFPRRTVPERRQERLWIVPRTLTCAARARGQGRGFPRRRAAGVVKLIRSIVVHSSVYLLLV